MTPATAEKVEEKWASMILEMNRCIANWQKSGQGEGGIDDADNAVDVEFGSLANRSQHALSNLQNFFRDRHLYLLYLWVMWDKHHLLGSAVQKLNASLSARNGSSGVPLVIGTNGDDDATGNDSMTGSIPSEKSKSTSDIVALRKSIEKHGKSLVDVAHIKARQQDNDTKMKAKQQQREHTHQVKAELRSSICQLLGEKRQLSIHYACEMQKKNKVMADAIMDQMKQIEMEVKENSDKLVSMEDTPKKNNKTPDSSMELS